MRRALAALAVLLLSGAARPAGAAVSIDLDLDRLRAAPGAAAIRERLDAALPAEARRRLAAMSAITGFDPRRDLHRLVLDLPGEGQGSARLVGVPAERLATLIDLRSEPIAGGAGVVGHPLPRRPEVAFVPVGADQALLTKVERIPSLAAPTALAPADAAIRIAVVPGADPHPAFLALTSRAEARGDGAGAWSITLTAKDQAAADELARRFAACQGLAANAADAGLPEAARWAPVAAGATLARDGLVLRVDLAIPAALRDELIERGVRRLLERLHGAGHG